MRIHLLVLLMLPLAVFAQKRDSSHQVVRPPFCIKTAPLNLINPVQQSFDLLADFPFNTRLGLEQGISLIFDSAPFANSEGETYRGIKIKPMLKYYIDRNAGGNIYVGLALKYNYITNKRYATISHQGFQYFEQSTVATNTNTWGWAVRVGGQTYLGKRERFILESYLAGGGRYLHVSQTPLPPDADALQIDRGFFVSRAPGNYSLPDFMVGITIGWVISR